MNKRKVSQYFTETVLIIAGVFLLYSFVYLGWACHYNHLLNREGLEVVATIIRKDAGQAEYDIYYEDMYYRGWIKLSKSAYRRIRVGEKYRALLLPDKLRYYHPSGITPTCFKLVLQPLPSKEQDIEKEKIRIQSMYGG